MKITIFYIPCKDDLAASSLSQSAITAKLAACGNLFSAKSFYPWKGELQEDNETILLLKTTPELKDKLSDFIALHHTYEVPCIMQWDVDVNEAYGLWIRGCVSQTEIS